MSRKLLEQVETTRKKKLPLSVTRNSRGHIQIEDAPPTHSAGLYWIYTSYTDEELKKCSSTTDDGAIDISSLAKLHDGLPNICSIKGKSSDNINFRLVYNGIAGKSLGIRARIHQHFNGGKGTGCLAIRKSSLKELEKWRVSYLVLEHENSTPDINASYNTHAKNLERIWRLKYGWPLLCKT